MTTSTKGTLINRLREAKCNLTETVDKIIASAPPEVSFQKQKKEQMKRSAYVQVPVMALLAILLMFANPCRAGTKHDGVVPGARGNSSRLKLASSQGTTSELPAPGILLVIGGILLTLGVVGRKRLFVQQASARQVATAAYVGPDGLALEVLQRLRV
jgi:hypothetical protein